MSRSEVPDERDWLEVTDEDDKGNYKATVTATTTNTNEKVDSVSAAKGGGLGDGPKKSKSFESSDDDSHPGYVIDEEDIQAAKLRAYKKK